MSSASKAKGTRFESAIVNYINGVGDIPIGARRIVQTGAQDSGDIIAGRWIIQAKDRAQLDMSGSLDAAHKQRVHYAHGHPHEQADYAVAILKRRAHGIGDSYVVIDLATFTRLLQEQQ